MSLAIRTGFNHLNVKNFEIKDQIKGHILKPKKELKDAGTLNLPYCFSWSSMAQYDAGLGP